MKRKWLAIAGLVALFAAPAFADWRFDIGLDAIFGGGALAGSDIETEAFSEGRFLTLPMVWGGYELEVGPASIGVGMRGISLIIINFLWPDVFAELELGPVAVQAHLGGLLFLAVGLENRSETGKVFIPELSAWFKLGKRFRLGAGAVGLYMPEWDVEGIPFLYYIGGKWVLGG